MSIYSNVTEQDLDNLRKLANQQKNERAKKIKNRILKQTHDIKLAESLSPITKKLDQINESTQKSLIPISNNLGDIIKETSAKKEIIPSTLLKDTFDYLSETSNILKLNKDEDDNLSILGIPIKQLGGDKLLVNDNIYEFIPEKHKALSNENYTGKSMKNKDDRLTLYNFLTDLGYARNRGKQTNQMQFFTRLIKHFRDIKKEEPDNLEGRGVKIIIPSNIIDIYIDSKSY